jgi:flagellar hook-associated protein 2
VTSASNTFSGVLTGVTFTATKLQTGVTLSMSADSGALADRVQTMVSAANGALTEIGNQTSYDASTKKAGPLLSDLSVQSVRQNVLSAAAGGDDQYGSFKQFGVQLDSSGKLTFDRNTFLAAYQADPAKTKSAVGDGLASKLDTLAAAASNSTTGTLTLAVQNRDTEVRGLNKQIADWGVRLKTRQDTLQRQFANLEVALGKMKDQSNWLAGQLAGLK